LLTSPSKPAKWTLTVLFAGKPTPVTATDVLAPPAAGAKLTEGFGFGTAAVAVGTGVKVPVGVGAGAKLKTALTLTLKSCVATRIINLSDVIGLPFGNAVGMANDML